MCDTISMKEKAPDYGLLLLRHKRPTQSSPPPAAAAVPTTDVGAAESQAPKWMKDTKALEYYKIDANSTLKLQLKPKTLPVHLCALIF